MPRVSHVREQQGFRPVTSRKPALSGARGLGALGDSPAPTGSYIKYTGTWTTTQDKSPNDILSMVTAALASDGLPVVSASTDYGAKVWIFGAFGLPFNVTIVMQVSGSGFAQSSDAGSIVNHEVYAATALMPVSSNVLVSGTGPGGAASGTPPPCDPAMGSCPGQPTDWSTWLQDNALWIGLGVAGLVLLPKVL